MWIVIELQAGTLHQVYCSITWIFQARWLFEKKENELIPDGLDSKAISLCCWQNIKFFFICWNVHLYVSSILNVLVLDVTRINLVEIQTAYLSAGCFLGTIFFMLQVSNLGKSECGGWKITHQILLVHDLIIIEVLEYSCSPGAKTGINCT